MEIVKSKENLEHLNQNIKDDFYKVPNLNFDIDCTRPAQRWPFLNCHHALE